MNDHIHDKEIAFVITVAEEGPGELAWCLHHLRLSYPEAPVTVVSDGPCDPQLAGTARRFGARFQAGERLKVSDEGARWWHRFFMAGLQTGAQIIFKLDPDARVWRRFSSRPADDFFGTLENEGTTHELVQGGCQGFSRTFAQELVASGIALDDHFKQVRSWILDEAHEKAVSALPSGYLSTDAVIIVMAKMLGRRPSICPEIGSKWKPPAPPNEDGRFAVTHPHKDQQLLTTETWKALNIVVFNFGAPDSVSVILERLLSRRYQFSLTLVDAVAGSRHALSADTLQFADRAFQVSGCAATVVPLVLGFGSFSEYVYLHSGLAIPGEDLAGALLANTSALESFAAIGDAGFNLGPKGEALNAQRSDTRAWVPTDFLSRAMLVRAKDLTRVFSFIEQFQLRLDDCPWDLLISAALQYITGRPCALRPLSKRSAVSSLEIAKSKSSEELRFPSRELFLRKLLRLGWRPVTEYSM